MGDEPQVVMKLNQLNLLSALRDLADNSSREAYFGLQDILVSLGYEDPTNYGKEEVQLYLKNMSVLCGDGLVEGSYKKVPSVKEKAGYVEVRMFSINNPASYRITDIGEAILGRQEGILK